MSTTSGKEKNTSYLTEAILSIHNEVQSSLDYISTKATEEGTEFGKSTAILSIQNLRIKVPIKLNLETGQKELDDDNPQYKIKGINDNASSSERAEATLSNRTGLILEEDKARNRLTYSKIKVTLNSNENQTVDHHQQQQYKGANTTSSTETSKEAWGEIEITFSPIKRQ